MSPAGRRVVSVAAILAVALAVLIGSVVAHHGNPVVWDQALHDAALHHRSPGLRTVAVVVSRTSEYVAYVLVAIAGALALRPRPWWVGALAGILVLAAGQGIRVGVAALIGRTRPPEGDWAMHAAGYAFPSGHTATATLAAGLFCVALAGRVPRGWLGSFIALSTLWAVADGVGRVYVGVHWPTDVVGGWLLGALLVVLAAPLRSAPWEAAKAGGPAEDVSRTPDRDRPEEQRKAGRR